MTWKEAIDVIEKEIHSDVRYCTQEDVNRFAVALRMAIAILREQDAKHTNDFTNADHIRSMTDEELMEVLGLIAWADCCINPTCDVCTSCVFYGFCQNKTADDVLEWLKLPYKEDT